MMGRFIQRSRLSNIILAVAGIALLLVPLSILFGGQSSPEQLEEAKLLAESVTDSQVPSLVDFREDGLTLSETPLFNARSLHVSTREEFWVSGAEYAGTLPEGYRFVYRANLDGEISDLRVGMREPVGQHRWREIVVMEPEGLRMHTSDVDESVLEDDPATPYPFGDRTTVRFPYSVGAATYLEDGEIALAPRGEGRIDVYAPSDAPDRDAATDTEVLLSQVDAENEITATNEGFGEVVALAPLSEGRLAFVAPNNRPLTDYSDHTFLQLWLFDGESASPVEADIGNPVMSQSITYDAEGFIVDLHAQPLAPGPDDTVIAISQWLPASGLPFEFWPQWPVISWVDPVSGEVTELITLEGVLPNPLEPVSAVAVGDDLVFLAEGKLWLLEDAFA